MQVQHLTQSQSSAKKVMAGNFLSLSRKGGNLNRFSTVLLGPVLLLGLLLSLSTQPQAKAQAVRLTEEKEGFICPVFSPDGQSIAMTREGWAGIWRMSSDGTALKELTPDPGSGYRFAWSSDSRHIAYRTDTYVDGKRHFAIRVANVETGEIEEITEFKRFLGTPQWVLGDGTIVFETDRDGTLAQVLVVGLVSSQVTGEPNRLVATTSHDLQIWISGANAHDKTLISDPQQRCFAPTVSPQGDWVCYTVLDGGGSIAVARTDGSDRRNLGYGSNPCWSPDGQYLACEVTADDGKIMTESDLYLIKVDGTGRIQLTDTPDLMERWPNWSPDGGKMAFSAGGSIYVMSIPTTTISGE
jgi:Tol biopolymer transport system component